MQSVQRTVAGDGGPAATVSPPPPAPSVRTLGDMITGPLHFGPRVSQGERKRAALALKAAGGLVGVSSKKTVNFDVHKSVVFSQNTVESQAPRPEEERGKMKEERGKSMGMQQL